MPPLLLRGNERRYDFRGHPERPPARLVDNRPIRPRPDPRFPVCAHELNMSVELGAFEILPGPRSRGDPLTFQWSYRPDPNNFLQTCFFEEPSSASSLFRPDAIFVDNAAKPPSRNLLCHS